MTQQLEPELRLNHPSQEGWWNANTRPITDKQVATLALRYAGTSVDVADLASAVDRATLQLTAHRQTAEQANVAKMHLSASQAEAYTRLAADTAQIGPLVRWFTGNAGQAFTGKPIPTVDMSHVSVELCGTQQHGGDWEAAKCLDVIENLLPVRLATEGLQYVRAGKREGARSYTLEPMYIPGVDYDTDKGAFPYALLGRSRLVGRVVSPLGRMVEIRKRSAALAVMSCLPDEVRKLVQGEFKKRGPGYAKEVNSTAAYLVGREFETAVQERGQSTAMVPIGANFLVVADRSTYLSAGQR